MNADQQHEYSDAVRGGDPWRARWVRVSGCLAFSKVVVATFGHELKSLDRPEADTAQEV